ncbi:hypothetical protein [Streptomyces sannanensis]|uniref:hypothetical protein n=1 Tax=Streptomyces sannanensis TaxID=285536 RepID=UPI0031E9ED1A
MDFFWRRVPGAVAAEPSAKRLRGMVPHWFDDEFGVLRKAGLVMAVENNGSLMDFVLTAGGSIADESARLPVFGGELRTEEEDTEYGLVAEFEVCVLEPRQVRRAAAFLRDVPVHDLVKASDPLLAAQAAALGFSTPWSTEWSASLVADLLELQGFFSAAADAGEAILKVQSA